MTYIVGLSHWLFLTPFTKFSSLILIENIPITIPEANSNF